MSRIRRPETVTIALPHGGDWIIVKKHLTAGEARHAVARSVKRMEAGVRAELDPEQAGLSQVVEYLLDWSHTDADGKAIDIRRKSDAEKQAAILALDPEDFVDILKAVQAHDDAMEAERIAEKNPQGGEITSSPISESAA